MDPEHQAAGEPVPQPGDAAAASTPPGAGADQPVTGDAAVDAALAELAAARDRSLEEQIRAGEQTHRVLRGRLDDLGGE